MIDLSDVLIMLGGLLLAGGIGWMYWPAGVAVLGLELAAAGLLLSTHTPGGK